RQTISPLQQSGVQPTRHQDDGDAARRRSDKDGPARAGDRRHRSAVDLPRRAGLAGSLQERLDQLPLVSGQQRTLRVALQGLIVAGRVQCPGSLQLHSPSDRLTASMHNRFLLFATKRLLFTIPQLFAVSVIVFFLIRLLLSVPSYMLAGPYASPAPIVEDIRSLE